MKGCGKLCDSEATQKGRGVWGVGDCHGWAARGAGIRAKHIKAPRCDTGRGFGWSVVA